MERQRKTNYEPSYDPHGAITPLHWTSHIFWNFLRADLLVIDLY